MARIVVKKKELLVKQYWRPLMAWQYLIVCLYDFLAAPIIYNHISLRNPEHIVQWDPITLKAGGLYHVAMAAIIGIYTWSRGLEKLKMLDNNMIPVAKGEELVEDKQNINKNEEPF